MIFGAFEGVELHNSIALKYMKNSLKRKRKRQDEDLYARGPPGRSAGQARKIGPCPVTVPQFDPIAIS